MQTVRTKPFPTTLHAWIAKTGTRQVSEILGVNLRSVYQWQHYQALPRPEQMMLIKRRSKGAVTCDSMVETYLKRRARA